MGAISLKMDKKGSSFLQGIQKSLLPATKNALKEGGILIKRNIGSEIRSFASSSKGKLDNSFKIKIKRAGKGGISKITVPSRSPYAGIHEDGLPIIRPKKQFLVIPLPLGTKRRPVLSFGKSLFFKGRLLFKRTEPNTPIFVQVKSVKIRAKRYLTKARDKSIKPLEKLFNKPLKIAVETAASRARK